MSLRRRIGEMADSEGMRRIKKAERGAVSNVWVRNILLALSLLVIGLFVAQICLSVFTRHNRYNTVPSFKGIQLTEARRTAQRHRLRIEVSDSLYVPSLDGGIVLEQKPSEGTQVKSGRRIFVTVNSYHQRMVTIPYVTGYSLRQAKNNLENVGLEISELRFVNDIAANNVLGETFNGKEIRSGSAVEAEVGSGVVLTIGLNPESSTAAVPDVTGMLLRDARGRILENGFNIGAVSFDEDVDMLEQNSSRVYRQEPSAGSWNRYGQKVSLSLTMDDSKVEEGVAASSQTRRKLTEQHAAEVEAAAQAEAEAEGKDPEAL